MGIIYGLFDPRKPTDPWECRYIGQTIRDPGKYQRRYVVRSLAGDDRPVNRWIRKLLADNVEPLLLVLEEVTQGDLPAELQTPEAKTYLDASEIAWIAKGRDEGWRLLNIANGGGGGDTLTHHPELDMIRERLSAAHKGVPLSESHRANLGKSRIGTHHSEETRRRISETHKNNPNFPNPGLRRARRMQEDPAFAADQSSKLRQRALERDAIAIPHAVLVEKRKDPEYMEQLRQQGRAMAAVHASANGIAASKRIRKCLECGLVTNAGAMGRHQKLKGHVGWETVSDPE